MLDLNGHTIDRKLNTAESDGYVIKVEGSLLLEDKGTEGRITGGYNSGKGGGVCVDGGSFTMFGGAIENNRAFLFTVSFDGNGWNPENLPPVQEVPWGQEVEKPVDPFIPFIASKGGLRIENVRINGISFPIR